jgi:transposase
VNAAKILHFSKRHSSDLSKKELISMIVMLRAELELAQVENAKTISDLREKLALRNAEIEKLIKANINQTVNQPSSKQPEFNKKTGVESHKKKKRKKSHKGRAGAGNRSKPDPDVVHHNPLTTCPECDTDLSTQPVVENSSRIVEDIPAIPEKTIISEEVQERKWCPECKKIVSSQSEAALPRSDIGLRALCLMAYLWVVSALSLPSIITFVHSFFCIKISTAGLSRMMIRLSLIMQPIYEDILNEVKGGRIIFADETGWRVKGKLWWLWIFANERAAYYWPDPLRSSIVVEKILGTVFSGLLVTDAWYAYLKIICSKQTCMAHIFRKIRKFRDAYPKYYSILIFYKKLKRILKDGERLQCARKELDAEVFMRRLALLKNRLDTLLAWKKGMTLYSCVISDILFLLFHRKEI